MRAEAWVSGAAPQNVPRVSGGAARRLNGRLKNGARARARDTAAARHQERDAAPAETAGGRGARRVSAAAAPDDGVDGPGPEGAGTDDGGSAGRTAGGEPPAASAAGAAAAGAARAAGTGGLWLSPEPGRVSVGATP